MDSYLARPPRRRRQGWLTLALAFALWILPGCDSGSPRVEKPGAKAASVCDLLTLDDLHQATDTEFKIGIPRGTGLCRFESRTQNAMGLSAERILLRLNRYGESLDDAVASYSDMMRKGMGSAIESYLVEPVEDVGDRALWEQYSGISQLAVFKTDNKGWTVVVVIGADGFGDDRAREVAVDLARRIVNRLGDAGGLAS